MVARNRSVSQKRAYCTEVERASLPSNDFIPLLNGMKHVASNDRKYSAKGIRTFGGLYASKAKGMNHRDYYRPKFHESVKRNEKKRSSEKNSRRSGKKPVPKASRPNQNPNKDVKYEKHFVRIEPFDSRIKKNPWIKHIRNAKLVTKSKRIDSKVPHLNRREPVTKNVNEISIGELTMRIRKDIDEVVSKVLKKKFDRNLQDNKLRSLNELIEKFRQMNSDLILSRRTMIMLENNKHNNDRINKKMTSTKNYDRYCSHIKQQQLNRSNKNKKDCHSHFVHQSHHCFNKRKLNLEACFMISQTEVTTPERESIPKVTFDETKESIDNEQQEDKEESKDKVNKTWTSLFDKLLKPPTSMTPLASNVTLTSSSSNENDNEIKNDESTIKLDESESPTTNQNAEKEYTPLYKLPDKDYVSQSPFDKALKHDGILPKVESFQDIKNYFNPFMAELVNFIDLAEDLNEDIERAEELATFIVSMTHRFGLLHEEAHSYLLNLSRNCDHILGTIRKVRSNANLKKDEQANESWRSKFANILLDENLKFEKESNTIFDDGVFNIKTHTSHPSHPDNDPDSDPSSSESDEGSTESNSTTSNSSKRKKKKGRKVNKKKSKKKSSYSSDSDSDDNNDKEYRQLVKDLSKSAKNYKMKELSMHPDPVVRREKFGTWIIDLQNILSTHYKTSGLIDEYPANLRKFKPNIDRAIKTLLFSITNGMAKRIVSTAKSSHKALLDLRRNYGQTSQFDTHRERVKMMCMRQDYSEKASEYLRRVRKQMDTCKAVGCNDYDEDSGSDNVVNIILQGLNANNRIYSATIAELKARFRTSPFSITLNYLEEVFFNIDDYAFNNRKRESANYIHNDNAKQDLSKIKCYGCNEMGHYKSNCPNASKQDSRKSYPKKDLSHIICNICKKKGHYANKCPDRSNQNKKKVTFESAHLTREGEESCKLTHELCQELCMMMQQPRRINAPAIAFAIGDFAKWLLDSGATSHFTPNLNDLIDQIKLETPIWIQVADGSRMKATHQGLVELHFTSDQGIQVTLRLLRVLYVPGLQTRLFSIESFVSDGRCSAIYSKGKVTLQFDNAITKTIELPHVPPGTYVSAEIHDLAENQNENGFVTYIHDDKRIEEQFIQLSPDGITNTHFIGMAQIENTNNQSNEENNEIIIDDPQSAGGADAPIWKPTDWTENKMTAKNKQRMNVELGHSIFGHRAISSLMAASKANVWDDVDMHFGGDSWCDNCKIAIAPRNKLSKNPMTFRGKPLEHLFIDCVPCPGTLRGIPSCRDKNFLFVCDPISKYVAKLNVSDKSSATTIQTLKQWRGEMLEKGFNIFLYLRSDAGTNFTSDEFKSWCRDENITLTVAGPKHQEQNSFVERAYGTASRMARSMLVHAHLPIGFYHFAIDYACKILRVLPAKGLIDSNGKPTTTYQIIHGKRPRVLRFKVFGCPVVFKRYSPQFDGDITTNFKQLQRGSKGIFVGFPKDQAGWLIFVPDKISNSHLVVSMDVVFDQHFLSGISANKPTMAGGQNEREVGKVGGNKSEINEKTGDITNLTDSSISHWGNQKTFESDHKVMNLTKTNLQNNENEIPDLKNRYSILGDENSDDESDDDDDDMPTLLRRNDYDYDDESDDEDDEDEAQILGSQNVSGNRRSARNFPRAKRSETALYAASWEDFKKEQVNIAFDDIESAFTTIDKAAEATDVSITPYLPEPRNLNDIKKMPIDIKNNWLKAVKKELRFLIENGTFKRGEKPQNGDEILPAILVFKAKVTSRGFLDKLKARCCARGDLQQKPGDPDELWSPCVFARTFKMFVALAVSKNRPIKQLDFIGAFCQGIMKTRLFIQLPKDFAEYIPEYAEYFRDPQLLVKSLYGQTISAKVFNNDLTEWLTKNEEIPFVQSEVDPGLYVYRNGDEYLYLICYIDDSLYFGSTDEIEKKFGDALGKRFKLELQGWSHWFLGTRLYREKDGSYLLDQENYIKHVLNRYCGEDSPWGLPPIQNTPAPIEYAFTKDNQPKSEEDRALITTKYKGLSMASAVSSLLYAALNTRYDILWITNKLAKSSTNPGLIDFEALMHVFGYLRKCSDYAIKMYANIEESPAYKICVEHKIQNTEIIGFSDSSWQDCPDTGRSTCGYKVFVQGGLVDAQSTLPVPVALSSAEAEYMGACNLGAMVTHLRSLMYDFKYLGTEQYDKVENTKSIPTVLLIDNQATVRMSKNYKVTSKNRHVGRRWHYVRRGVKDGLFKLFWVPAKDQLADDMTKTQIASKQTLNFQRTLIKIPDRVKGFKSNVVGNR